MTATRRISRRRLRLLLERLQAPRAAWRSLVILPVILLCALLGMQGSAAWFTSGQQVPNNLGSGSWATLMDPDTPQGLSFTGFTWDNATGRFRVSGLVWNGYTGSFSVTSTAGVSLSMRLNADAGGPTVKLGNNVISPSTFLTINPNQALTFTLTGDFVSWSGNLEVAIGENRFDWITIPLTIQAEPRSITSIIHVVSEGNAFCSGTAAPKFEDLKLMTVYKESGAHAVPVKVTLTQSNPYPLQPDPPHNDLIASLISPPGGTFTTTTQGTEIHVHQGDTQKGNPTTLTLTLSSTSPDVTGTQSFTFLLAHSNSDDCPLHGGSEDDSVSQPSAVTDSTEAPTAPVQGEEPKS